jgi:hypothetical protein
MQNCRAQILRGLTLDTDRTLSKLAQAASEVVLATYKRDGLAIAKTASQGMLEEIAGLVVDAGLAKAKFSKLVHEKWLKNLEERITRDEYYAQQAREREKNKY